MDRIDVEVALGRTPEASNPLIAADAIDELLDNLTAFPWLVERFADFDRWGQTLHLHAPEGEWLIDFAAPAFDWSHQHAKASAAVTGPATALLMLLYGRTPPDDPRLTLFGDTELLGEWQRRVEFRARSSANPTARISAIPGKTKP